MRELTDDQVDSLIYFDYMLLHIHDDMAECNPKLKKHLRFYEDNQLEEVLNNAVKTIESCKGLLKEGVQHDFLSTCLSDAFLGDTKVEVQSKLQGQSIYTILCRILGMMKSTKKVFKLEVNSADLAKALSTVVSKPAEASLKRYIDEGATDNQSKLARWINQYIMEKLGNKGLGLFLRVAQK